jgi:hypothetical protein
MVPFTVLPLCHRHPMKLRRVCGADDERPLTGDIKMP